MRTSHFLDMVRDTVLYIERHLNHNLALDTIAAALNVSKYHLHRVMRHATGMPLMEYIRARRLSKSVDYLLNSSLNIIDIGTEFSFTHEQSYIRAFKKHFGITPSTLRKTFQPLTLTEAFDLSKLSTVAEGLMFEPTFIVRPLTHLVGKRYEVHAEDNYHRHTANAAGNEFLDRIFPKIRNKSNNKLYIGFTQILTGQSYSLYYPSTIVKTPEKQDGMDNIDLPPHKYVLFKYVGDFHPRTLTYRQLQEIWSHIDAWFPQSPYVHNKPHFFEYIDLSLAADHYCEVDLYIPFALKRDSEEQS